MMDFIERTTYKDSISAVFKNHYRRSDDQKVLKTVYVVKGFTGSGKTTLLLNYFKGRDFFYFSFAVSRRIWLKRFSRIM
jgi:Flp pilus assembly CpaF family ATPase